MECLKSELNCSDFIRCSKTELFDNWTKPVLSKIRTKPVLSKIQTFGFWASTVHQMLGEGKEIKLTKLTNYINRKEIQASMDYRHSMIIVWFPKIHLSDTFFSNCVWFSNTKCVWNPNSQKFRIPTSGFQALTVAQWRPKSGVLLVWFFERKFPSEIRTKTFRFWMLKKLGCFGFLL